MPASHAVNWGNGKRKMGSSAADLEPAGLGRDRPIQKTIAGGPHPSLGSLNDRNCTSGKDGSFQNPQASLRLEIGHGPSGIRAISDYACPIDRFRLSDPDLRLPFLQRDEKYRAWF